ncbi:hypothetical protein B0H14DRAFT_2611985 [Mycena olivaceomarginata]|nr:hypothetical protein B0H14DRAFT_2611985 [Mycena olivaceomarginata]
MPLKPRGTHPSPPQLLCTSRTAAHLPLPTFNTSSMLAALGAYTARVENKGERYGGKKHCTVTELIQLGFQLIPWNSFDARPLLDSKGRQTVLTWLENKSYTALTNWLLANPDIAHITSFASFYFKLWAPQLYDYYFNYNKRLSNCFPELKCPFPKLVFSCAAFNFGSNVWTVQAPQHDLKLVVEFPPGTLILLPSATIAHSNIPVDTGIECILFTQFMAGGLFCYMDNGFRTQANFAAEDPDVSVGGETGSVQLVMFWFGLGFKPWFWFGFSWFWFQNPQTKTKTMESGLTSNPKRKSMRRMKVDDFAKAPVSFNLIEDIGDAVILGAFRDRFGEGGTERLDLVDQNRDGGD